MVTPRTCWWRWHFMLAGIRIIRWLTNWFYAFVWIAKLYHLLVCIFIPMSGVLNYTYVWPWFKAFYTYFWFAILYLHLLWLLLLLSNWILDRLYLRPVLEKRISCYRPLYILMAPHHTIPQRSYSEHFARRHVLGQDEPREQAIQHQIGAQKHCFFSSENCNNFWTRHTTEVKLTFFDYLGDEESVEPYSTSVVCLIQILLHLFKIAFPKKWRCLFQKPQIKFFIIWK